MDNPLIWMMLLVLWGLSGAYVLIVIAKAGWKIVNSPSAIAICLALSALIVALGLVNF